MQADAHIWRTSDGQLVTAEDPKAEVLAYAPGDDIRSEDAEKVRALGERNASESTAAKQSAKPEDKQVTRDADKGQRKQ